MGGSAALRVLLDTHIWIWRLLEPERLPPSLEAALADRTSELHLSPISVWETLVLARRGRLSLDPDPHSWVRTALHRTTAKMVPLTHEVAMRSEDLSDLETRDPADRFLVATALVHGLTLATADQAMRAYPPLATLG